MGYALRGVVGGGSLFIQYLNVPVVTQFFIISCSFNSERLFLQEITELPLLSACITFTCLYHSVCKNTLRLYFSLCIRIRIRHVLLGAEGFPNIEKA